MAAGGREFAFVGEAIYDLRYPHPKKIATKDFITDHMSNLANLLRFKKHGVDLYVKASYPEESRWI